MEIRKTIQPNRGAYRSSYSPDDLQNAFLMVIEKGVATQRAAARWGVPITTLKDRVSGRVHLATIKSGKSTMFSQEEESLLVDHLKIMSEIRYGYTRQETINLATDYASYLGHRDKTTPLSLRWLYNFLGRWPDIRVQKPRKLEYARARSATREAVDKYFVELHKIIVKFSFQNRPEDIYNIDEKGLQTDINPPKLVSSSNIKPQAVTTGKSQTVTLIEAVSAIGNHILPFFVFPGQRMRDDLMEGASPGATGTVSETGWSNTEIVNSYMMSHFSKYATSSRSDLPLLVLYDGHKSHVSLGLIQWAKENNIILFVLPPHTSHLLQPLDIGCYGPVECGWISACHAFLRESGGRAISRYDIFKIACKVLLSTLTPGNIISSFRRAGIFPFNADVVSDIALAPSLSFKPVNTAPSDVTQAKEFLEKRGGGVLENVQVAKTRRTVSKIVAGKAITDDEVAARLKAHHDTQNKKKRTAGEIASNDEQQNRKNGKCTHSKKGKGKAQKQPVRKPVRENPPSFDSNDSEIGDGEVCCVCNKFSPAELKNCTSLTIVKWAECSSCGHWVHLGFCSSTTVVRRHSVFLCPHCSQEE